MSFLVKLVATLAVAGGVVATVEHVRHSSGTRADAQPADTQARASAKLNVPTDKLLGQRIMVGLPGTTGFVGEFLALLAAFRFNTWLAIAGTTGIILSAGYALWLYRRIIFGVLDKSTLRAIADLKPREIAFMAPLAALVIFFGFYPKPVFDVTRASVAHLVVLHTPF
jgi:NADH:ubiquinone oxidoreductase subunit 4 (subunit M)